MGTNNVTRQNFSTTGACTSNPSTSTNFSKQQQPYRSSWKQPASFTGSGEGTLGTENVSQFRHLKSHYQPYPRPLNWRVASAPYIAGEIITPSQSRANLKATNEQAGLLHTISPSWLTHSTFHTQSKETAAIHKKNPQVNYVLSHSNFY